MKTRTQPFRFPLAAIAFSLLAGMAPLAQAHAATATPATLEKATYAGRPAWRLSDGRTEAVIVPALGGRVMSYGYVGGANWLWHSPLTAGEPVNTGRWANWGGDKTWPGPQSNWKILSGRTWPPDADWDGGVYREQVFPGGTLRTEGPVSPYSGARVIRTFSYGADGEFIVQQRVQKTKGEALSMSIWSVTQIARPDAVYLPAAQDSLYAYGYLRLSKTIPDDAVQRVASTVLKVLPNDEANFKIGTDAPLAAIAAVRGDAALILKSTYAAGSSYPSGPGVAVELYNCKDAQSKYMELELLSPLRPYYLNTAYTQTVRWSLHQLPSTDAHSADTVSVVQQLLEAKPSSQ